MDLEGLNIITRLRHAGTAKYSEHNGSDAEEHRSHEELEHAVATLGVTKMWA